MIDEVSAFSGEEFGMFLIFVQDTLRKVTDTVLDLPFGTATEILGHRLAALGQNAGAIAGTFGHMKMDQATRSSRVGPKMTWTWMWMMWTEMMWRK